MVKAYNCLFYFLFLLGCMCLCKEYKNRFLLRKVIQSHPKLSLLSQNTIRVLSALNKSLLKS